jgi:hypothetical protein
MRRRGSLFLRSGRRTTTVSPTAAEPYPHMPRTAQRRSRRWPRVAPGKALARQPTVTASRPVAPPGNSAYRAAGTRPARPSAWHMRPHLRMAPELTRSEACPDYAPRGNAYAVRLDGHSRIPRLPGSPAVAAVFLICPVATWLPVPGSECHGRRLDIRLTAMMSAATTRPPATMPSRRSSG